MQVLGFGDFYYELGVQIVEACLATRPLNGGLMEMKPLMRFVNVRTPSFTMHPASYRCMDTHAMTAAQQCGVAERACSLCDHA